MDIAEGQEMRSLDRGMPFDDPAWGEVSAFLDGVGTTYARLSTDNCEAAHLAAVSREAGAVRKQGRPDRDQNVHKQFTLRGHRVLVGAVVALTALLAGIGVASALGGGPLGQFMPAAPAQTTPAPTPTTIETPEPEPTPTASEDAGDQGEDQPRATSTAVPDAQQADAQGEDGDAQGEDVDGRQTSRGDSDDQGENDQGDQKEKPSRGDNGDDQGEDGGNEDSDG